MILTKENVYVPIESAEQAEKAKGILEEFGEEISIGFYKNNKNENRLVVNIEWIVAYEGAQVSENKTKITLKQLIEILVNGSIEIKEPLLVSMDGVELFDGDEISYVWHNGTKWTLLDSRYTLNSNSNCVIFIGEFKHKNNKAFASKENAEKWIEGMNKPKFKRVDLYNGNHAHIFPNGEVFLFDDTKLQCEITTGDIIDLYKSLQDGNN